MKSLYSTLGLLILVIGGGAWIWFNERAPVAAPNNAVLLRIEPARVQALSFVHADGERIAFFKNSGGWEISREGATEAKIASVPADENAIQKLLNALQLVQTGAALSEPSRDELRAYGLARPTSTLMLEGAKIEFGVQPSFDPNHVYARVTSDQTGAARVALLSVGFALLAQKNFDDWRDKSTLAIAPVNVNQLEIETPNLRAKFERTRKGEAVGMSVQPDEWQMRAPLETRADFGPIRALLDALPSTQAARFLDDAPKNLKVWGLDKPAFMVRASDGVHASTLRVGKTVSGGRAAQNSFSSSVFVVPEALLKLINHPLRDWRGKRVLVFEAAKVDAFSLRARGKTISFARDQSDEKLPWRQTGGATKNSSPQAIRAVASDLLFALKDFAAIDFLDAPQVASTYGFDKPTLEFSLQAAAWPRGMTVQVGEKNGKIYARAGEGSGASTRFTPPVFVLPHDALDELKTPLDALFPEAKKNLRR